MAACDWTKLQEDWDDIGSWIDSDANNGVSEISPSGQLRLYAPGTTLGDQDKAQRYLDIGTLADGDYTLYMRFKGDDWGDATADESGVGMYHWIEGGTYMLRIAIGNWLNSTDGIALYNGSAWVNVYSHTWADSDWHTLQIDVHNGQTDADVYVDGNLEATDAVIERSTITDGIVILRALGRDDSGTPDGHEYHIDYLYINDGLCTPATTTTSTSTSTTTTSTSTSTSTTTTSTSTSSSTSTSTTTTSTSTSTTLPYYRDRLTSLPSDDSSAGMDQLTHDELLDAQASDDVRVSQDFGTYDNVGYFLFKDADDTQDNFVMTWEGQSTVAPSSKTIYLQVYNFTSGSWETLDSDNTTAANTDFTLTGDIPNATNYLDGSDQVVGRVYQDIG